MSKILFISNISNKITSFAVASISAAHAIGMEFYHASNWQEAEKGQIQADEAEYGIRINDVPISRNPTARVNRVAYKKLVELIKRENIDYIHCNTPTGGILGRLAGKKCKVKKVIYQVHGFHFYKGSSKKNWLLYYPIEKWLARHTDALITINQEDFALAKAKFKLRNSGKVHYVPGVGINTKEYLRNGDVRRSKRTELGLSDADFCAVSVGRLDKNKNNATLIRAIATTEEKRIKLFVCGDGAQRKKLEELAAELGVGERVIFLGNRNDMRDIYSAADLLVMASFREGLSRTVMEAMSSGLPCVISKIRGNTDLVEDGKGGFLCVPNDVMGFAKAISVIATDAELRKNMGEYNVEKIKQYDSSVVQKAIEGIYRDVFV